MSSMTAVDFRNHLVLQSKRLTTFAELRSEVVDIFRSRAATAPAAYAGRCSMAGRGRDGQRQENKDKGSEDTSTNQDTKRKCVYCDEVRHMQKDCQKRNSDTVSAQKHGRRHEKERKCSGSESAIVGSFDVNLLVDIEPGACGADHAPDDFEEPPLIDRDRLVFGLTKRKVVNVPGVSLNFCIMPMSLHVESAGAALAPEHVSACSVEGQEQLLLIASGAAVTTCPLSHAAHTHPVARQRDNDGHDRQRERTGP